MLVKPKFNLPVLNNFRRETDERNYWPKITWEASRKFRSKIDPDKLKQMAIDTGFTEIDLLNVVCNTLKVGANIGCSEEFRGSFTATSVRKQFVNGSTRDMPVVL